MNEMMMLDSAVKLAERVNELEQLLEATLKSHTEEQEMAVKAEARVKELEDAIRAYMPKTWSIYDCRTQSLANVLEISLAGKEKP